MMSAPTATAACGCRIRTSTPKCCLDIALPNDKYTPERIRSMYGTREIDINFPTPIPVHITYQTAFVDDAGKLQIRKDVYGRDARLLAAAQERRTKDPENWSPTRSRATGRPPQPARRQLRQRTAFSGGSGLVRLLRAAVRRPAPASRPGRPAAAAPRRQILRAKRPASGLSRIPSEKINGLAPLAGPFCLTARLTMEQAVSTFLPYSALYYRSVGGGGGR